MVVFRALEGDSQFIELGMVEGEAAEWWSALRQEIMGAFPE